MKIYARPSLVFLTVVLVFPVLLIAQDDNRKIETGKIGGGTGLIGDSGAPATGGGNGVKVKNSGGNKIINVKEDRRDIEIVIRADGHIFVNITKHFGPDELDSLIRRQPDLEEYVKSFPKTSGDKDVQLSIGLTSRYDAANGEELKEENIAAYNLYKKFSQRSTRANSRIRKLPSVGGGNRNIGPLLPGNNGRVKQPDPGKQNNNGGDTP